MRGLCFLFLGACRMLDGALHPPRTWSETRRVHLQATGNLGKPQEQLLSPSATKILLFKSGLELVYKNPVGKKQYPSCDCDGRGQCLIWETFPVVTWAFPKQHLFPGSEGLKPNKLPGWKWSYPSSFIHLSANIHRWYSSRLPVNWNSSNR